MQEESLSIVVTPKNPRRRRRRQGLRYLFRSVLHLLRMARKQAHFVSDDIQGTVRPLTYHTSLSQAMRSCKCIPNNDCVIWNNTHHHNTQKDM